MADTAAQARTRKVIGLPDDQEFNDANVRQHLARQGFTDPSFINDAIANGAGTSDSLANMTPVNVFKGYNFSPDSVIKASDPMSRNSQFIDSRTGQAVTGGGLTADQKTLLSTSGKHKTYETDVETGKRTETTQHPWRDALKNTAMIWGGPETAGILSGAFGGGAVASAASGAGAAHSTLPMIGGGLSWTAPSAAAGTTAGTAAGTAAAHSLLVPTLLNSALGVAGTKLGGGSWRQALASGAVSGATTGLGPRMAGLSPTARTVANFGINQGSSALMRAAGSNNNGNGQQSTYGRGSEGGGGGGIGPSGGNAPGFSYGDTNPNIADALAYGAKLGKRNQPFRAGYDVNYPGVAATATQPAIPSETRTMPRIYSPNLRTGAGGRSYSGR